MHRSAYDVPPILSIGILGERWPALETLRLTIPAEYRSGGSRLNITVTTLKWLCLTGRPIVTAMVGYMAQHPDAFPFLRSLELESCPEWDILIIMLEQRLLANVQPLERLIFSRAIPPLLKNVLAHIIHGHVRERSSNYELSMQGNSAIFLDATM
ncbi:hypothetical protein PIIN_11210 [Serendipita indica DSM 11827]|uniref:Uncharacterized protein n=1 Tax=Serendipita indica (strain DSM 11827) TaxID=1109443 RepID=G4U0Y4_SERID|nr:hypothetical protein PIIN_11210 [Serendipita indica DSM 11827]